MDIYFNVIDYNNRKNIGSKQDYNYQEEISIEVSDGGLNSFFKILMLISSLLLVVAPFNIFSILCIAAYVIYLFISKFNKISSSGSAFDTTLHFTDEGITFYGAGEDAFEYENISELILHFHGVKNDANKNLSFFSFMEGGKNYQYYISVDSEYPKNQLIKLLKFLYESKIPIKELNAAGKEMKFLSVLENKMTAKTEKAYLDLIENIGKENEKEA